MGFESCYRRNSSLACQEKSTRSHLRAVRWESSPLSIRATTQHLRPHEPGQYHYDLRLKPLCLARSPFSLLPVSSITRASCIPLIPLR